MFTVRFLQREYQSTNFYTKMCRLDKTECIVLLLANSVSHPLNVGIITFTRHFSRFTYMFFFFLYRIKQIRRNVNLNPFLDSLDVCKRLQGLFSLFLLLATSSIDMDRSLLVISVNGGRASGSMSQHCSISFFHSGVHVFGIGGRSVFFTIPPFKEGNK